MITSIEAELDYGREVAAAQRLRHGRGVNGEVQVPVVYPTLSSDRMLVMDEVIGRSVADLDAVAAAPIDRHEIARRLLSSFMAQILRDGYYHADPHPGNVLIDSDGTLVAGSGNGLGDDRHHQQRHPRLPAANDVPDLPGPDVDGVSARLVPGLQDLRLGGAGRPEGDAIRERGVRRLQLGSRFATDRVRRRLFVRARQRPVRLQPAAGRARLADCHGAEPRRRALPAPRSSPVRTRSSPTRSAPPGPGSAKPSAVQACCR